MMSLSSWAPYTAPSSSHIDGDKEFLAVKSELEYTTLSGTPYSSCFSKRSCSQKRQNVPEYMKSRISVNTWSIYQYTLKGVSKSSRYRSNQALGYVFPRTPSRQWTISLCLSFWLSLTYSRYVLRFKLVSPAQSHAIALTALFASCCYAVQIFATGH